MGAAHCISWSYFFANFPCFYPYFSLICNFLPQNCENKERKKRENAIQANAGSHPNASLASCEINLEVGVVCGWRMDVNIVSFLD